MRHPGIRSVIRSLAIYPMIVMVSVVLTATCAQAHFVKFYNNSSSYWFQYYHVPDLDQVRNSLPNNGTQYCVPTTSVNWIGYLTNHGALGLMTGPKNWEAQGTYNEASFLIALMGSNLYMNTEPQSEGTTVPNSVNGLRSWLGDGWVVTSWIRDEDWSPSFDFLASKGMNGGHLIPGVGWYYPGNPCLTRKGGHAFAVVNMARSPSVLRIEINDPATDDDEDEDLATLQSLFTTETYHCVAELRNPDCNDPAWHTREMYRIDGLTRTDSNNVIKLGYLDYVRSIFPQFLATAVGAQITYVALEVDGGLEPLRSFTTFNGDPIVDVVLSADLSHSLAIVGANGDTELWAHKPGFERWEQIDVDAEAPSDVVSGRHREAYVIDGGVRLICFDIDTHVVEADVQLPAVAQAITYCDASDEVILLSTEEHVLMRYQRGLQGPPTFQFLNDVPIGDDASIACDPTDGAVWCIVVDDPVAYRVSGNPSQPLEEGIKFPSVSAPQAIDVSDYGRVFVSDAGTIKEFERDGNGEYQFCSQPFFEGRAAGHVLSVARSRTNFEQHLIGQDWFHEVPTGFAESMLACRADIDGDSVVAVGDLLALFAVWGEADPFADIAPGGGDLNVGVQDLIFVLSAWGPCPVAP